MRNQTEPTLPKWPFYLGDALLLGAAGGIYVRSKVPMTAWEMFFVVVCVAGGAAMSITPFLLKYLALLKLVETHSLTTVVAQVQNLEKIGASITDATGRWQTVQEHADKTLAAAREISERMAVEARAFAEFMGQANDCEKATLRLETEKLRRAESDWLQVSVRMLDHVYALHQGALRSGQPNLVAQLASFQNACRETARRVGLASFVPNDCEPFDAQRHEVMDGNGKPPADAIVGDTVAAGYTFQGRLLRPALVRLRPPQSGKSEPTTLEPNGATDPKQDQLPLERSAS